MGEQTSAIQEELVLKFLVFIIIVIIFHEIDDISYVNSSKKKHQTQIPD